MKLIINADDFGLTIPVSQGIIKCIREGVVTETSAIVNSCYFLNSSRIALFNGIKTMGLHCLLTVGRPISNPSDIPSLLNEEGSFHSRNDFENLTLNIDEVKLELEAQIRKFKSSGLILNHLTTHHGFMTKNEEIHKLFIDLAKENDVPLRNELSRKVGSVESIHFYKLVDIKCVDKLYFNHNLPYHSLDRIINFLMNANDRYQIVEIGCHPGFSDEILRKVSILNDDREKEMEVFLDNRLKVELERLEIDLISYNNIK